MHGKMSIDRPYHDQSCFSFVLSTMKVNLCYTDCSAMSAHHNITEKGNGENLTLKERKSKVKTREKNIKTIRKKTAYQ